ncbi:sugar phosphate isomerase/epimerase family protein [Neptunicella sp. SCSIO 80796]|uniref:sugar phosphate isomerase/epimerase family protein n=1 Tax=Neptunicella plasticusilytica TaxID=3117012 RepID=UPI003A4D4A9E
MSEQIYVSTSGIRTQRIGDAVRYLAQAGYRYIELSGGTKLYPELEADLISLKSEFALRYRCHNYFPPPATSFVMNLSSSGETINRTLDQVKCCLALSQRLGADKLGIHAGFRIDPGVDELGQRISSRELLPYAQAVQRFQHNLKLLQELAMQQGIDLYIENNVYSLANKQSFQGENPFLLTHFDEYKQMQAQFPFKLLVDVAHLKVSCHSLGLAFETELAAMLAVSDYVHISDNDGTKDSNGPLSQDCSLYRLLKLADLSNKTFTLEVYGDITDVAESYESLVTLLN